MGDNNLQDTSQNITDSFIKGLNKDSDPSYVTEGMWTHAINMVNNSKTGKVGSISNESANYICFNAGTFMPATATDKHVIGTIYLFSDKWVIFTVGHDDLGRPVSSEIGLFEESQCSYRPIVIDSCLKFDKRNLISGVSRLQSDCTWQVYWVDGLNTDKFLNIGDPQTWPTPDFQFAGSTGSSANYYVNTVGDRILWPGVKWNQDCKLINSCEICTDLNSLDCDKIRLARLMTTPTLKLKLGQQGGNFPNGTYFITIAYLINGQKVTDYFTQSNYQFIYTPNDLESSLDIEIEADSENFDEFELVLVECTNQQTTAKRIGAYSTNTKRISLDQYDNTLISVPLEQLPLQTPVYVTSDQMAEVNNYLLRVGPKSKFDFNYQPLANLIKVKWASVEYPGDYYMKGGNKTNYLRDEVYSFFIRWVYDTGDKSSSYHIPGRPPRNFQIPGGTSRLETASLANQNSLDALDRVFEVYNTATINTSPLVGTTTDDGGKVLAVGDMGYWESTETYPDKKPEVWNASNHCWTGVPVDPITKKPVPSSDYDLCGLPIRHHKFPEDYINNSTNQNAIHFRNNSNPINTGNEYFIRLMGVYFENITIPKDNDGNDIPGVVGYEILRGSREGNKTIVAKGMVNNFRSYKIAGDVANGNTGLYANYPFNTIKPISSLIGGNVKNESDPYIHAGDDQYVPDDIISFHSPDTMFSTPFLPTSEFKLYGQLKGYSVQQFTTPSDHPKFKLLSDIAITIMIFAGIVEVLVTYVGKRTLNQPGGTFDSKFGPDITGEEIKGEALTGGASGQESINGVGTATSSTVNVNYQPHGPTSGKITGGDISTKKEEYTLVGKTQMTTATSAFNTAVAGYNTTTGALADLVTGQDVLSLAYQTFATTATTIEGGGYTAPVLTTEVSKNNYLPLPLRILGQLNTIATYFSQGADIAVRILYAATAYRQYALQMMSYGYYSNFQQALNTDTLRFKVDDSFYLRDNIQTMSRYLTNTGVYKSYSINNLKRSATVVLRTKNGLNVNKGPKLLTEDLSLVTLGTLNQLKGSLPLPGGDIPNFEDNNVNKPFSLPIQSHYGAIKGRVRNQYGQVDSIKQITINSSEQKLSNSLIAPIGPNYCDGKYYTQNIISRTPVFFGGDTYINRYTEKNNMMFFYDWLFHEPDGFEYNYYLRSMIPHPRFRVNSKLYEMQDLASIFTDFKTFAANATNPGTGFNPSAFYDLDYYEDSGQKYNYKDDKAANYPGFFSAKRSYFYLASSSIRDFFVESEVLVDFRKQDTEIGKKFYDPYRYTNYPEMFNIDPLVMGVNTSYQYDYSLSITKLYNQYFSLGSLQNRYYNPEVSQLCYTYYPNRIIYSLPQQDEMIKDSWLIFLVNNYKQFKSNISGVKSINKSGIVITFKNDSPLMYQGVDTLQTDLGTKVTIGDGGLFSQPPQQLTNADKPYEYGASQNRLSVVSTPVGIYYISQSAGKIFSLGEGLQEISQQGMKWWFTLFLPYKLTQDFPEYPYQDNPVAGIGCQSVYDNTNSIMYFSKKDYKLKEEYQNLVTYIPLKADGTGDYFTLTANPTTSYKLGDPVIFKDASWTISYDPKNQFWISFHDWHPDLYMPTKDVFISTKGTGGWRHNWVCDKFCNYYGIDYACEIDMPITTGQTITTLRSIEYIFEAYRKNYDNCVDTHHVLDFNFDKAVIYNSEQVSGYLNLNIYPKNDLILARQFPKLNGNLQSFDILFSKEENKYRLNQFWDITKDRGEFPIGASYPSTGPLVPNTTTLLGNYANENMWLTEPDGYTKVLNPNNVDYNKPQMQRKKFRHYMNFLNLKRSYSGDVNLVLKINNTKAEISQR